MYESYKALRSALDSGETTCRKVVEYYLSNIHKQNGELNAFLEVYEEEALAQADAADAKIKSGEAGPLAGLVIGLKDVICHKDHGLQASSKILDGFISHFSAPCVERLLGADAIIIGRQNCDEFAMGSSNENSAFGDVKNNIDNSKVPGGSSGGSAVAVSADMCMVSLGSDTGGSVRQPAAFCGVVGFKPTYSRISRYGLIAYASSFDTIGPIAKNVDDIALVMEYLAGADEFDATVSQKPVEKYASLLDAPSEKLKVGYIKETVHSDAISPEVKKATLDKIAFLKAQGHDVVELEFPLLEYSLPTYYIITTAEASTNLSRFDGVRYGHRSEEAVDLEEMFKKSRSEGFGEEVKRRITLGTFVLSASYYDAYFTKAQKVRRVIKEKTDALLQEVDFLLMPTTPTTAFDLGKYGEENLVELYLADLLTVQASVCGLPAISIPNGVDEAGLPIGLQLVSKSFSESKLLAFSKYLMENAG